MELRWVRTVLVTFIVLYINCVLTNIVSLRQRWFVETFRNGTALEPLHDTMFIDWFHGHEIPFKDLITLRDLVDVFSYTWVVLTLVVWFTCSRKPILVARALVAQIVLISTFSISQLLTIVPDSTPNCLELYNIPKGRHVGWVFWKYPLRSCGNMLWSSDITQLVIFTSMATQMAAKGKIRNIVWFLGECWIIITMALIFTARYQYSVDVVSTIVVTKLVMGHQCIDRMAKKCFIRRGNYYERAPVQELVMPTI